MRWLIIVANEMLGQDGVVSKAETVDLSTLPLLHQPRAHLVDLDRLRVAMQRPLCGGCPNHAQLLADRGALTVVDDPIGQPTWMVDLVDSVVRLDEAHALPRTTTAHRRDSPSDLVESESLQWDWTQRGSR